MSDAEKQAFSLLGRGAYAAGKALGGGGGNALRGAGLGLRRFGRSRLGSLAEMGIGAGAMASTMMAPNSLTAHTANAAVNPVSSAVTAIPNAIRMARAGLGHYNGEMRGAVQRGADRAVEEFLDAVNSSPTAVFRGPAYENQVSKLPGVAAWRRGHGFAPSSGGMLTSALSGNVSGLLADHARPEILKQLAKSAGIGGAVAGIGRGLHKELWKRQGLLGKGMTAGLLGLGAYRTGKAVTGGLEANDLAALESEGYRAAQAQVANKLHGMSPWQRRLAAFDPTLAAGEIERTAPNAFAAWQKSRGINVQPGMLRGLRDAWMSGGTQRFYTTDSAEQRIYL